MFGIDVNPSGQENSQYNALNAAGGFATGAGESDITAGSTFFQNLLTDPMKALAPEISAGQTQAQQAKKTTAEFAPRSGGTAATTAAIDSTNRGNIINLMGGAQTTAASNLTSTGTNLLGQGIGASETGFNEAQTEQQQRAAMWNDIIKSSAAVAGGVVGALPGAPGGAQDVISNLLAGAS